MSRISFTPQKRSAAERRADTLFSLRVQVEQAARRSEGDTDPAFRAGLLDILDRLDRLHRRNVSPAPAKRNRPYKLKPIG